ncbi:MAG: hypothetical protein JKY48_18760 [Flavobacteriales bacterium]|nr:hypothetical protein [Flavobacteriales bacterium]
MKDLARSTPIPQFKSFSFPTVKKILLVDSNPFVANQFGQLITQLNHLSMGCLSSIHTIEKFIETKSPDLIIINIETKGNIDGYQIAKILKLDHEFPLYILYREDNLVQKKWAEELNPDGFILYSPNNSVLKNQLQLLLN